MPIVRASLWPPCLNFSHPGVEARLANLILAKNGSRDTQSKRIMSLDDIVIVHYDPSWPQRYTEARAQILAALGGLVVDIEHFGSTSVPGLRQASHRHHGGSL